MKPIHVLMALALAAPLAAQKPDSDSHGMGMGPHRMMGPMMGMDGVHEGAAMRMIAFAPEHLLAHKDDLKLTDAQVAKLTTLRDGAKATHDAAMNDMRTHGKELASAWSGASVDTAQLKPHFQAMQAAMAKAHWAMITAATQARAVLTDVQRARAEGWADAMEHMGPMMGPGGMGHPMMGPGPGRDSTKR
ncbi:MAG TPA: Spy/CpxP family protein refolding chaperone [Gemmatimonadales bacterium]|nr:Spy/CpxP family protein refolding chaperone [Gemmatimonadales bacterium]